MSDDRKIKLDLDYLGRIRGRIHLATKRKTSNVLSGGFTSLFLGPSLDFNDLKEYTFGDNVKDIDWRASSRAGKTLVRRYVAERKHNILFIGDCGSKMKGDTSKGQQKSDLALMVFGTFAYLADRQGADFSLAYSTPKGVRLGIFRSGTDHLEEQLYDYRDYIEEEPKQNLEELSDILTDRVSRRKITVYITDMSGLAAMDERVLRKITYRDDVKVICIDDAYLAGSGTYDIDSGFYPDDFFLADRRFAEAEREERKARMNEIEKRFSRYRVGLVTISGENEIVDALMALLGNSGEIRKKQSHTGTNEAADPPEEGREIKREPVFFRRKKKS